MNQLGFPLLSIIVFLPAIGAVVALFLGRNRAALKIWALVVTLVVLALAGVLLGFFDHDEAGFQFVDQLTWIEALGISYQVGVDGISLWMLLLAALLCPVAVLVSWKFLDERPEMQAAPFIFFLLLLETGVLGVFAALDLILFFIFWEAMLVPAYFLIGRWGGERRVYASLKFFLYTMAGSALMLVAIIAMAALHYQDTGAWSFGLPDLYGMPLTWAAQIWLFVAFFLAFAVKAPVWPLHTWLPDAYVESPTPVTILLAAVLSKMGIYGMIRFCLPLFPDAVAAARPWIWLLAIIGILYGSLIALVQRDMKRLIAFSSLAHMGLIVAGVLAANEQGVQGAIVQSVSHGLTVTALFVFVALLEARRGTRQVDEFGGLWKSIPIVGTLLLTVTFASIGLPGLSGFPGEFTMLVGIFQESTAAAAFAALGIVLGAWYMLDLFRKTFVGPLERPENRTLSDLRRREAVILLPLVALMFVVGILPGLILRPTAATVNELLTRAEERRVVLMDRSGVQGWAEGAQLADSAQLADTAQPDGPAGGTH
ncbi:MAG: NADH-quinone oxidoreductase subunit M [Anaerolineae bacterium]|nr:NADH-quinone oxidoreductase subunit M [Anaerolineae bacterium]